ncbi:ATP-binding protein [Kamptonema animale CS-326]|jgi:DNA gyrase subunit B|nr:ATP-binding protein [Kamptonema animale]MDB9513409.1 ATP-binding protein [Kamptonema animale CS-326]
MTSDRGDRIQVLEGIAAVRKRPGMYIGSTGPRGLHHLVYEVVDTSLNEVMAGYCTHIEVDINADGSVTVTDDGRGIPTDIDTKTGKSFLEKVLTVLYAGDKCDRGGYKVSGGLHGVGIAVINALSEWLEVTVWREEQIYTQRFERGIPVTELIAKPSLENRTGTSISFLPDSLIFKTSIEFDFTTLAIRLQELAYLNAGLKITLSDRRLELFEKKPLTEVYHYQGGIREYFTLINSDKQWLHEDVIYVYGEQDGVQVEAALQWCTDSETEYLRRSLPWVALIGHLLEMEFRADQQNVFDKLHLLSFANLVHTIDGGTHVAGVKAALLRTVNRIVSKRSKLKGDRTALTWQYLRDGLTCIISVKLLNPEYEGPVKSKLANREVQKFVDSLVEKAFTEYLELHPQLVDAILEKAQSPRNRDDN